VSRAFFAVQYVFGCISGLQYCGVELFRRSAAARSTPLEMMEEEAISSNALKGSKPGAHAIIGKTGILDEIDRLFQP
jgi:hypothetical protein